MSFGTSDEDKAYMAKSAAYGDINEGGRAFGGELLATVHDIF